MLGSLLSIAILFHSKAWADKACSSKNHIAALKSCAIEIVQKTEPHYTRESLLRIINETAVDLNAKDSSPATHQMPLTVVVFKDSGWTIDLGFV